MKLVKIIENLSGVKKIVDSASLEIKGLSSDSRKTKQSFLFIAIKGSLFNGTDFIDEAVDRGAVAVIMEQSGNDINTFRRRGVTYIYVSDARRALSEACRAFYGDISNKMRLIGVTGTNGKTTITYLVESLFKVKKEKSGVIGTVNYRFGDRLIPAVNTTPDALDLYSLLSSMYKAGLRNCILEVSSHSLDQGRVDTLSFDIAVFTNITSEHLDYHRNLESYLASKIKLFTKIKRGGCAVINTDDDNSEKIINKVLSENKAGIISYGIDENADLIARDINYSPAGLEFKLCTKAGSDFLIKSSLIGRHNVYNILAASACGIAMGMDLKDIALGIKDVTVLPGRLEKINCGQDFMVFVDYAHTENGMENVLKTLKDLNPARILVVFGCGGNRDRSKRPNMGRVSSELSDKIFITSDNPRNEDPTDIANEIVKGINVDKNNYVVELDRFRAITKALKEARKGDIVLVAGKGHEAYQIFKDVTVPFDDREVVRKILTNQDNLV